MKGALLLIGVLVCASMTEASSVRWARKAFTAIQNHRHFKDTVARGKIHHLIKDFWFKEYFLVFHVTDDPPHPDCGDNCDLEFVIALQNCPPEEYRPNIVAWIGCLTSFLDSDCHDCLCDWIYTNTGVSCPSAWRLYRKMMSNNMWRQCIY